MRLIAATGLATLGLAASASAGTINYTITPSPAYAIQDNGNGIVKVTYNGCVTAGVRQELAFQIATNVGSDSNATFSVLREEGEAPAATFTPATIALQKGAQQTLAAALSFTVNDQNNGVTTFRIKLDPESGEGLGQGAGVMVSIPCVLAASGSGSPTQPTAGALPAVASTQARGSAPCLSSRTLRLRARRTSAVRVTVTASGETIAGALVRITAPGYVRSLRTDARGQAAFNVRAGRSGTAIVQSDVCFGARRIAVLGAVAASTAPRFTG